MIDPRTKRRKRSRFVRKLIRAHNWPRNLEQITNEELSRQMGRSPRWYRRRKIEYKRDALDPTN